MADGFRLRLFFTIEAQRGDNGSMSWIDDGERKYREQKATQQTQQQIQLHKAEVLQAKARPVLDQLVEVVARDVLNYSERFKTDPERRVDFTKKSSGGFKLDKAHYPAASVECSLEGDQIKAVHSHRPGQMSEANITPSYLRLEIDGNDNVTIKPPPGETFTSLDDVSRYLIERVLYAC